jgi:hypothetical protein
MNWHRGLVCAGLILGVAIVAIGSLLGVIATAHLWGIGAFFAVLIGGAAPVTFFATMWACDFMDNF